MAAVLGELRLGELRRTRRERSVVIVGRRSMQNRLVADMIDQRLGCSCEVRQTYGVEGVEVASSAIALLDVQGMSARAVDAQARVLVSSGCYRGIALMNVEQDSVRELAYVPGVRGIFQRDASPEHLLKGLQAMLSGEYWLPRSVLAAHFERTRLDASPGAFATEMTPKEMETLRQLLGGQSNNAIARCLGVSPHTVKTHLYNLFRKIGAKNRVQAVKWALENVVRERVT